MILDSTQNLLQNMPHQYRATHQILNISIENIDNGMKKSGLMGGMTDKQNDSWYYWFISEALMTLHIVSLTTTYPPLPLDLTTEPNHWSVLLPGIDAISSEMKKLVRKLFRYVTSKYV